MTTIHEQYREQRRKLAESYIMPTRITFSPAGYTKMRAEHDSTSLWNTAGPSGSPDTYDGWPYSVVNEQAEEVKLHNAMTDQPRGRQNAITVQLSFDAANGQCLADGQPVGEPITTAQIIGSALTAAQLCDIIRAWLDADCQKWGKFEHALDDVLERYGTFE